MSEITIKTNNHPRPILDAYELEPKEREEFDYIDWKEVEEGAMPTTFFRYKGEVYDLGEFMRLEHNMQESFNGWHGYQSDTFFSGTLIKYVEVDNEICVIAGRYYS